MVSEPSHRHRSRTRGQSRSRATEPKSPSPEPSQRRYGLELAQQGHSSPTRDRSAFKSNGRDRKRQDSLPVGSKSRPPGSVRGSHDTRGKTSIKRPRIRFSTIELEGGAETLMSRGTCSGFLRKQADNEPGAWNQYYFVVKPLTYLFYYNSKEDKTPRGIIDLEYLTDVKRNVDCLQRAVGGSENCFRVSGKLPRINADQIPSGEVPKMRPVYLDTEDREMAKQWITAIRRHRFSIKKDEQFSDMVQQLRDAETQIVQLTETQQKESESKRFLRIKAKTLLQKLRAVDSGKTDEVLEAEIELDDTADDMLAMLEGMEDVLVRLHTKLDQQKQEIAQMKAEKAGTTSSRRGFTQVLQRAVTRRENTSYMDIAENDEEETIAAIRNRRHRKPADQVMIEEKPTEKRREKAVEKIEDKLQVSPQGKPLEQLPALQDNVSDVLAMWKAKKKKSPSMIIQASVEDASEDGIERNSKPRSVRGMALAPESGSARKQTAVQRSGGSERLSEEDTASLNSTEDRDIEEKLPPGWTKYESRGYPGTFYYANEDGEVSWDVPTDDNTGSCRDDKAHRSDQHSGHDDHSNHDDDAICEYDHPIDHDDLSEQENEPSICLDTSVETSTDYLSENETDEGTVGGTTSAAYRKQKHKPKPKSAWAFKLPKLLPTTAISNPPPVPPDVAPSLSPIRHGANHHEF